MQYTFSMPYIATVQPQGLSIPVHVWYDKHGGRMRIDLKDGLDSTISTKVRRLTMCQAIPALSRSSTTKLRGGVCSPLLWIDCVWSEFRYFECSGMYHSISLHAACLQDVEYAIVPRINETVCTATKHDAGGPRAANDPLHASLQSSPLPSLKHWQYMGTTSFQNQLVSMWQLNQHRGDKTNSYTFYVTADGTPVKMQSVGVDLFDGSHFDQYVYEFTDFKAGPINIGVFAQPAACKGVSARNNGQQPHSLGFQLRSMLPAMHLQSSDQQPHSLFAAFKRILSRLGGQGDGDSAHDDYAAQLKNFAAAHGTIKRLNKPDSSQGVGYLARLNRFATWDNEAFLRSMLPNKFRPPVNRTKVSFPAGTAGYTSWYMGTDGYILDDSCFEKKILCCYVEFHSPDR